MRSLLPYFNLLYRSWALLGLTMVSFYLCSCVGSLEEKYTLQLEQDVMIATPDNEPKPFKKGEAVKDMESPLFIEAEGHVGLLVVPNQGAGTLKVRLKPIQNWGGARFEKKSDDVLSEVVAKVVDFQTLVSQRNYEEALATVSDLQKKYPEVRYLSFLKASSQYLLKRNDAALSSLTDGLNHYPDNKSGLALYKALSGKEYKN